MSSKQSRDEKKALVAMCPEDAQRIKVKDEFGKDRYREIGDVRAVSYTHLTLPTT